MLHCHKCGRLYKYKDGEPQYGDKWYTLYDQQAKVYSAQMRKGFKRDVLKVNLRAKRVRS